MCAALLIACRGGDLPSAPPSTVPPTPLCDASDPAQVVAPQRISLLTSTQLMNMIRLVSEGAVQTVIDSAAFDVTSDFRARFPPALTEQFQSIPDATTLSYFSTAAQKVGEYVRDNFAAVTHCASPATDACATAYLDGLAQKAYRRKLTAEERERFSDLYAELASQIVNDQQVTLTVPEATGFAVQALLLSPQLLWRWELGGETASSPAGVYLTDTELASNLSFFLTDGPPDDALAADAEAGTLRPHLLAHASRILQTQAARDWLTRVMGIYFTLNQLPGVIIDNTLFPIAGPGLYADLETESRMFLADVMWNGKVDDLLTSRKAFPNSNLAPMIYGVPAPQGATPTTFVATTLPADQRAGMLTNAGFLTRMARATGVGLVPRGLGVKALFTCMETPPPPPSVNEGEQISVGNLDMQTAQEQVAFRASRPACAACHATIDPYGLALEWYDVVGRYRTVDDLGQPVDGHTTLPAEVGGAKVQSAVELAGVLTKSDVFTKCIATSVLQYALINATVELPVPLHNQAGCAAAGVAHALRTSNTRSFTDLFLAAAASPAFSVRRAEATAASGPAKRSPARASRGRDRTASLGTAAAPAPASATLAIIASRRSTFRFVARELDLLRAVGPTDVRVRLDNHFDAVVAFDDALTKTIDTNFPAPTGTAGPPSD
jgi:hypothetical protein